ncbi:MAG: hypothetical protein MPN21_27955 [Thermoanaerobaculia bacterium]|nr:hypothetical protein [Thermoanaerobaculia bacterium]
MRVKVVCAFGDYKPPRGLPKMIGEAMALVPERYLAGLELILLRDSSSLRPSKAKQSLGRGRRRGPRSRTRGVYIHANKEAGAQIELYIDNIFRGVKRILLYAPGVKATHLVPVLYHEVGHHIHSSRSIPKNREAVAEEYSEEFSKLYYRHKYSRWRFLLKVGLAVLKPLSKRARDRSL